MLKRQIFCPICKKNSVEKYKPFCSLRCKQIDLLSWINEEYKIETDEYLDNENKN